MTLFFRNLAVLFLTIGMLAEPAMAIDPIPQQHGWSGFVLFGGGYTELINNEVAGHKGIDTSRDTIESIYAGPPSDDDFHGVFAGELSYTWAESRTQVFIGSAAETLLNLDLAQQLGVRREFGDLGAMQAGILFSGVPADVWEDPFVEGEPRVSTNRDSRGLRFQWDNIFGSDFEIRLSGRKIDIDPERSGDFLVDNGELDPADQPMLDRNGDDFQFRLHYKWMYAPGQRLEPHYVYINHDRDGSAVAGKTNELRLTWLVTDGQKLLSVNGWVGQRDYDQANPIYGRKADKDYFGISGLYIQQLPWESRRWSFFVMPMWSEEDSDIAFYDGKIITVMAGLLYRFGNLPRLVRQE